jgi:peroxiredoxin
VNRAETIEKQLDFLKNNLRITYPILLDPSDSLARAFGVTIMPTTFVLNSEGIVIQHKLGQYASLEEITNAIKYGRSPLEEIPVKGKT